MTWRKFRKVVYCWRKEFDHSNTTQKLISAHAPGLHMLAGQGAGPFSKCSKTVWCSRYGHVKQWNGIRYSHLGRQSSRDYPMDAPPNIKRAMLPDAKLCYQEALNWSKWTKGGCNFTFCQYSFDWAVTVAQWQSMVQGNKNLWLETWETTVQSLNLAMPSWARGNHLTTQSMSMIQCPCNTYVQDVNLC